MNKPIDPKSIKQEVQNEIAKKQQAIIRQYQYPLSQGQNMQKLQSYIMSSKPVGSAAYLELPPILQEIALKLNLSSIEILMNNETNPFKKLRYKLAMFATKKMSSAGKSKKQLQKERETKLQSVIAARQQKDNIKNLKKQKNKFNNNLGETINSSLGNNKNANKNAKRKPIKKPIKK
jgi:hypothetical protein